MELLHDTRENAPDTWVCDCDECWDILLEPGSTSAELPIVVKCSRGRVVIARDDLRAIAKRETIDEFVESIGLGTIREMWLASGDTPIGRVRRGA
jgi:hypothetical protein